MEKRKLTIKEKFNYFKSDKKAIAITLIAIIIIMLLVVSTVFALANINNLNMMQGVYINGVELSGMSQSEAKEKIEALTNEKLAKELTLAYQDYNTTVNATILELNYDVNSAIEEAYSIGRSGNLIANNYEILNTMIFKKNIDININLNEEAARNSISDIAADIPEPLVQSSYYIEEDELVITKGKKGNIVDEEQFINNIKNNYKDLTSNVTDLELPVVEKEPDAIDVDKIHEEIYKEAKDAYYNEEPFEIYPEVEGVDFNVEDAKEMLKQDQEEYIIKLIITKPNITIEDLSEIAFKDVLATFSTRYDASNVDRSTNLKLAAEKINGTVLAAGDEFSYNKVVGERTIAAGYKEAKVYSNGEVVDGLGGGICQISSTLYNSVVLANLEVTERRNHQFVTSYLPAGRDATVVYGSQDFKFKNTRKYPIKVEATVANGIAKITIYGIKENPEYEISLQTTTISTIPFSTVYKDDSSVEPGEEKVKQKGANGLVTETYKIVKSNGAVVSKTLLSKDVYNAMQKIILKNPKTAEPEQSEQPELPVTPTHPIMPTQEQPVTTETPEEEESENIETE